MYACRVSDGGVIKYDLTTAKDKPQDKGEIKTAITSEFIRDIFKGLENADGATLFKQVAADVDWTATAPVPLSATAFCAKNATYIAKTEFRSVIDTLKTFLVPVVSALDEETAFSQQWKPGGPWRWTE